MRQLSQPLACGLISVVLAAAVTPSASAQGQDLQATFHKAKGAMADGRFEDAAEAWTELVNAVPGEPGLRLNLGMALVMAHQPREAIPHLEAAAATGRQDLFPASFFLGIANMELGQTAAAVKPLETFLAAQPDNIDARQMLAEAFLDLGRHDSAAEQYRQLTQRAPEDPRWWYGLGKGYEGISEAAFTALQTEAPESAWILLSVAEMMVAQERDKSAFALYREALEKRPDLPGAHEGLAGIYQRDGHPDWAATELEKARASVSKADPGTPEAAFHAGRYQAVLDETRDLKTPDGRYWRSRAADALALDAYSRVEGLGASAEATLIRVAALKGQRRYAQTRAELEQALEAWPDDIRLARELAMLHFIAREYAEARPLLEELLKGDPTSAELNLVLGELWVEQREPEKAIPYLEEASRDSSTALRARAFLGRAYLDSGDAARAVPHLEAALATDEDGSLHFQLARAYQLNGQRDLARETRRRFQEIQRAANLREEGEKEELQITPP